MSRSRRDQRNYARTRAARRANDADRQRARIEAARKEREGRRT